MLILDLWGISFHVEVVFGLLNKALLFKSALGHCGVQIELTNLKLEERHTFKVNKIKIYIGLRNKFGPIMNVYFLQKTNSILCFSRQMQVLTIQVYARQL